MRNVFLLFLGLAIFSCTAPSTESEAESTTESEEVVIEEEAPEATPASLVVGDGYQIETVKGDLPSPRKEMSTQVGETSIKINYGSPSIKGRKIWGGLEPYGEVWRTGANEATTIELTADVKVEGETLVAGKYALFTIPNEDEWVVIFNSEPDQWGDYKYDDTKDVLRVTVKPQSLEENVEAMDFVVEEDKIVLKWGKLAVPFTVGVS